MANNKNSFTILYNGIVDKITTDTTIVNGINNLTVKALWDTGANCCCISEELVKLLNLSPVGKVTFYTPSGSGLAYTYLVDIVLPNNMIINGVKMCSSKIGAQNLDLLIGTDIINKGDFAISNYKKNTCFTFRIPSKECIDFS